MPRQVRIEYEGAFYHAMARGNRRNPIFASPDGRDEALFLETLGDCCGRTGFRIWAWVLMRNHYHLLVETPRANLVAGMGWLQNAYTRRFNSRHRQWGRFFGDRYKSGIQGTISKFGYSRIQGQWYGQRRPGGVFGSSPGRLASRRGRLGLVEEDFAEAGMDRRAAVHAERGECLRAGAEVRDAAGTGTPQIGQKVEGGTIMRWSQIWNWFPDLLTYFSRWFPNTGF